MALQQLAEVCDVVHRAMGAWRFADDVTIDDVPAIGHTPARMQAWVARSVHRGPTSYCWHVPPGGACQQCTTLQFHLRTYDSIASLLSQEPHALHDQDLAVIADHVLLFVATHVAFVMDPRHDHVMMDDLRMAAAYVCFSQFLDAHAADLACEATYTSPRDLHRVPPFSCDVNAVGAWLHRRALRGDDVPDSDCSQLALLVQRTVTLCRALGLHKRARALTRALHASEPLASYALTTP